MTIAFRRSTGTTCPHPSPPHCGETSVSRPTGRGGVAFLLVANTHVPVIEGHEPNQDPSPPKFSPRIRPAGRGYEQ